MRLQSAILWLCPLPTLSFLEPFKRVKLFRRVCLQPCKNLPGSKATLGTQFCRSGVRKPVMQHRSTPLLIGGMGWILRHLFSSCPPSMPVHVYHHSTQLISNSSRSQSHSHALCGYDFHDDTGVAPAQCWWHSLGISPMASWWQDLGIPPDLHEMSNLMI